VFTKNKANILKKLHAMNLDFRKLSNLKNAMFDSEELRDNKYAPMHVWKEQLKY